MKKLLLLLPLVFGLTACEKAPTQSADDLDREIEQRVAERLADERREEQARRLEERERELNEKERDLSERERAERRAARAAAAADEAGQSQPVRGNAPPAAPPAVVAEQSYDLFYTSLDPYGDWMDAGRHGYVFRPYAATAPTWRPYTNGYWGHSDFGWTWVSYEDFGWACYHYGRWTRLRGLGWVWIPGEEWAPAWVSWRTSDDYVGWAPLPPEATFEDGGEIGAWADGTYDIGPTHYTFVNINNFSSPTIVHNVISVEENTTIVNKTVNVTNIRARNAVVINNGPVVEKIRSRGGRINQITVERRNGTAPTAARPGQREVIMSAPKIRGGNREAKPQRIKQRVEQAAVETGWAEVENRDRQGAQQLREKIREEAKVERAKGPAARPGPPRGDRDPQAGTPAPAAEPSPNATAAEQRQRERDDARAAQREAQQARRQSQATPAATATPEPSPVATSPQNQPRGRQEPAEAVREEQPGVQAEEQRNSQRQRAARQQQQLEQQQQQQAERQAKEEQQKAAQAEAQKNAQAQREAAQQKRLEQQQQRQSERQAAEEQQRAAAEARRAEAKAAEAARAAQQEERRANRQGRQPSLPPQIQTPPASATPAPTTP